ncbi:MAG: ABC transporter ATP-binding protein [Nitrospirae bacterium]|nr:ABC transporter ATP-binding protein [Nitrospirota bacterium]
MIEIKELNKFYDIGGKKVKAVDNASLTVQKGEMLGIVGHSGSGKTTLLSLIGGLTKPDSGSVVIDGNNIWSMNDNNLSDFRNKKISFIYQFASLIPTLTVFENIILPVTFGTHAEDAAGYATQLCEAVGMCDKMQSYPSQLSGGQQRRVAIARAFITNPEIVLADEPTGDLDEENEADVLRFFKKINDEKGTIFIIVTHNSELARQTGRQMRMSNGIVAPV